MKKLYIVSGIAVLALAFGLVVYINRDSPTKDGVPAGAVAEDLDSNGVPRPTLTGLGSDNPSNQSANNGVRSSHLTDAMSVKLDNFIANARLAEEFKFLDEQMDLQFERLKMAAGPEELATFEELRNQLKGEDLLAEYREVLSETFSEHELEELNATYQDADYVQFKEAEAYGRTPEGMKEQLEFSRTFKPEKLPPERLEALKELVAASGAPEHMKGMLDGVGNIFGAGAGKMNSKDAKVYEDLLMKSINEALLTSNAKIFQGQSVDNIKRVTKTVSNSTLQKAEAQKIRFITQKLVKVVEPKIQEAMNQAK